MYFHFASYRVTHIGVCVGLLSELFVPHFPLLPGISERTHRDELVWSRSVGQKTNMVWLGYRLLRLCTHRQQWSHSTACVVDAVLWGYGVSPPSRPDGGGGG